MSPMSPPGFPKGEHHKTLPEGGLMGADWSGRRVLVTGHTGFKGGWLSLWLNQLGAQVSGCALPPESPRGVFQAARVEGLIDSHHLDIRDAAPVQALLQQCQPEVVFHLAAQPLVRLSYREPLATYATNVMGTAHVLEAVRHCPSVRVVVVVTSDKCYENREWHWGYREDDALGGHDPYSNSKGCTEMVAAAYRNSYFAAAGPSGHRVALATARAGNVVGGGDWAADRLVPDILRAIEAGEVTRIRSPHALRPWQHVLEPLSGYIGLAERMLEDGPAFAQAWNFGPSDRDVKPVQWIVEHMVERWGDGAAWALDDGPQPHEATYLKLDASKAIGLLGWRARWSIEQTLDAIIDWHRAQLAGRDMREQCLAQIAAYRAA